MKIHQLLVVVVNLLCLSSLATGSSHLQSPSTSLLVPSDASALLAFKYKADLGNKLEFSANKSFRFCKWKGVQCAEKKVVRVTFEGLSLGGIFPPNTLSKLDQLRVLSLQNNSLTGPIPDLSSLVNLKVLFLDHNLFTGSIPLSIFTLHRLKTLDLSYNNLTGSLPISVNNLNRLYYLRLDSNRINGSVPPLNQSSLQIFNISHNTLSGPIPVTKTLSRFKTASFSDNKGLCGEIIHKECRPIQPFFSPSTDAATKIKPPPPKTPAELGQNEDLQNGVALKSKENKTHKRYLLIIGVSTACLVLICSVILLALATKKHKNSKKLGEKTQKGAFDPSVSGNAEAVMRIEEDNNELEEKVKRVQQGMQQVIGKSGSLMFCAGEVQVYTLEQLMRASAELLGRGTMGTTYKAVLDNRLIVCVKRLDGGRLAGTSKEEFEQHMESVGGLRHPNLVPLRAYFQAREERLLVYDYQPNGSLFSLVHGSKSSRAKPLHWTSCLKIAEDVAQGLSYIHQAWRLVHGNLKSSNVLLGSDFEACIADYCLSVLAVPSDDEDPDSAAYKAPEIRKLSHNHHHHRQASAKSDVYSFGILLLELLTGKHPSEHPYLMPDDMIHWVKSTREDHEGSGEDNKLEMLLEVAMACRVTSPEQRPTMWQVLKMIQEIKESVIMEDSRDMDLLTGTS
ncbi:probable inactive receptor kinase At5g67200 [Nicotiana sylvestris]|uniref:Probable inactive receptor kinase At5g67200 n=1 Tax=Nicotiana sylvestris TaxID=4096 RepID=A0A1U7X5Y1_NICSY|nr:PREDICTED: probable inactive receptor kinase At5g67200 [Nicotiana sylvestris]